MSITMIAVTSSSSLSIPTTRKDSFHARKLHNLCSLQNQNHLKTPINLHPLCKIIARARPQRLMVAFSPANVEEEEEEEEKVPAVVPEGTRLYVGNLPYSVTGSELQEVFGEAGRVESVEVVYDRVTDRSRGFGFVTMGSVEEAKEAIRMFDGSQVGGRSVKVNFPEVPRGAEREVMGSRIRNSYRGFIDSPYKVYAGNLGWRVTSEMLKEAFEGQPGLLSAKVMYDRDTGKSRGYGFLSFAAQEEAQSAIIAMNGVEVEGRPLRLNLAVERERPSSPPLNP